MTVAEMTNETSPADVKSGDLMAFTMWAEVNSVQRNGGLLRLRDVDRDSDFSVEGKELVRQAKSADRYQDEVALTKTKLVEVLSSAHNVPFTVVFTKANGQERKLRGRLIGVDKKNLGYLDVEDLDKEEGDRFRLVDCRTLKSVIVNGVKYSLK